MTLVAVVDTETTGTDLTVDRVVELARVLVDVERGKLLRHDSWLFSPGDRGLPPEARAVHHLSPEELEDKPEFNSLEQWDRLGQATYLAAHNAAFDRGFVQKDIPSEIMWLCTLKLARVAYPDAPGYGNQVLRYHLDLDRSMELPRGLHPHRALYDAVVTSHLLLKLSQHFDHDFAQMIRISSEPSLLRTIGFGKHRGVLWKDAPRDYLRWIARTDDWDPDVKHTAKHYLEN